MYMSVLSSQIGEYTGTDLVQVIILSNQLLQLGLNIDDLLRREFELDHRNASFLEMLEESHFRRLQEHQTATLGVRATGRTANPVDIVSWVIGRVELDNPVDGGNLSHGQTMRVGKELDTLTSKPRAATSVQINVPWLALQNSKKVLVRFCCFCFP